MVRLSFARVRLLWAESLDSRFEDISPEQRAKVEARADEPRWPSLPYRIIEGLALIIFTYMTWKLMWLARVDGPNRPKIQHLLSTGWNGLPVDHSDEQYAGFRDNMPTLLAIVVAQLLGRKLFNCSTGLRARTTYDAISGCIFLLLLHGAGALKVALIMSVNFAISRLNNPHVMAFTWVFQLAILFLNEYFEGYPLGHVFPSLAWVDEIGAMPRWEILFKCTILRMISYNFDYVEALGRPQSTEGEKKAEGTPAVHKSADLLRITTSRPIAEYSFTNYVAHCLYVPLYLAGPILSFNDYMAQSAHLLSSTSWRHCIKYAIRFTLCFATMEMLLQGVFVGAIMKTGAYEGATPYMLSVLGLYLIFYIWLKLLIPWRFFRMWALLDGIDPPENMIRCVSNNYSALGFWRAWHRSFHKWVVRYMYVPLGGNKRPVINSLLVFSFVAIWHDVQLRLLIWGWLIVLFVLPEVVATLLLPAKKFGKYAWYRHVCALGAICNIWMMMIANLIGFALGVDGVKKVLTDMLTSGETLVFFSVISVLLYWGVIMMFEWRQCEFRRGLDLKC